MNKVKYFFIGLAILMLFILGLSSLGVSARDNKPDTHSATNTPTNTLYPTATRTPKTTPEPPTRTPTVTSTPTCTDTSTETDEPTETSTPYQTPTPTEETPTNLTPADEPNPVGWGHKFYIPFASR